MSTDDYAQRAQANAPRTAEQLRTAARQMMLDGHGAATIAQALQLDVLGVKRLLGSCLECAE